MIRYYKTLESHIQKIDKYEENCWIQCVGPNEDEINYLMAEFNIQPEFLRAAMDSEETSRIDKEGNATLLIIDSPFVDRTDKSFTYSTFPLSVIITSKNVITISLKENSVIEEFSEGLIKNARPEEKIQFAMNIMLRMSGKYLRYLNQIDKIAEKVEEEMKKSMKNKELIQLLEIQKSLVYFSTSLRSINLMLAKIDRGKFLKLHEEDKDLLEDVMVEMRQATEMSELHLNILCGTMDAFASIISNNLNIVMKRLASITIILSLPTIVTSFFGMNNFTDFNTPHWITLTSMCGALVAAAWIFLKKTKML